MPGDDVDPWLQDGGVRRDSQQPAGSKRGAGPEASRPARPAARRGASARTAIGDILHQSPRFFAAA